MRLDDKKANAHVLEYLRDIKRVSNMALNGEIDENEYRQELQRLSTAALALAFLLGDGDVENAAGQSQLRTIQGIQSNSSVKLSKDIFDGNYSAIEDKQTKTEGKKKLNNRLILWSYTLASVYHLGQEFARPKFGIEPRYEWFLGNTEEHCSTCLGLQGVVLTTSEWRIIGHRPQGRSLECGGWNCDCQRKKTDKKSIGYQKVKV